MPIRSTVVSVYIKLRLLVKTYCRLETLKLISNLKQPFSLGNPYFSNMDSPIWTDSECSCEWGSLENTASPKALCYYLVRTPLVPFELGVQTKMCKNCTSSWKTYSNRFLTLPNPSFTPPNPIQPNMPLKTPTFMLKSFLFVKTPVSHTFLTFSKSYLKHYNNHNTSIWSTQQLQNFKFYITTQLQIYQNIKQTLNHQILPKTHSLDFKAPSTQCKLNKLFSISSTNKCTIYESKWEKESVRKL